MIPISECYFSYQKENSIFIQILVILSALMNPVCDMDVDVYVVAEGPQDREADVVSSIRERTGV